MKVDKISYQKIFPTGMMYLNHKIGVELQLDDGDDIDWAFQQAKAMIEKWNLESNPGMAAAMEYMKGSEIHINPEYASSQKENSDTTPTPINEKIEGMKSIIKLCHTKTFLEKQKAKVEELNDSSLTEAYNSKLKSFE